ncbi:integrase [Pseudomonas mandelii]|nr:integrase [Pseudomonas mandelii]TWS07797.1 integrase [Pseudomonas mandelii]
MSQSIRFTPKRELSAKQNLREFVTMAKDNLTLWSDLKDFAWNADRWPTTYSGIRFINHEYRNLPSRTTRLDTHQLMHPAFTELAKAYLRYRHTIHPQKSICMQIQALRVIEYVLRIDMPVPDITKFEQRHWEAVVSTIVDIPSRQGLCSHIQRTLKMLADFFILQVDPGFWSNPYVGQHSYDAINGANASSEAKLKKIPDQDALLAIAEVFSRGTSETQIDNDIMITCVTGLLMSAPMRIGETLRLRTDCLRDDADKDGKLQNYLAYWVPKSGHFARKAIPKTMATVATDSIRRLSKITEEGRRLARYMETNPDHFYRHANCPNVPDDQVLSSRQVVQALGFSNPNSCMSFVKLHTGSASLKGFTLDVLWNLVLKVHRRLNPHFPYQENPRNSVRPPLRMSESLLCFRRFQLSPEFNISPVLLAPYTSDTFGPYLSTGPRTPHAGNFFRRNGYGAINLKSHSLRHLLNRLGRSSGVSIELLTDWSSRATIRQTRTYLHDDPLKAASDGAALLGTIQEQEPLTPVTYEEAELYGQGPFHRSRYGICRRSWRAGPCNKFADCLNCSELLMCKGDKIAAEIIKLDRDNLFLTYTAAQRAIAKDERAASRWTEKAGPQIERLDQLLAILHNPDIPDGSPIEMAGEDFSHEKVIMSEKAKAAGVKLLDRNELRITYGDDLLACLELLRSSDNA